jgi:peptide/nickel transport system substrate-binding protein
MQTLLKEYLDGSIGPNLAASYQVNTSKEAPSITFQLQRDVKFHDGTVFNADAVKWNLEEIRKAPAQASTVANWGTIDVLDTYTVRLNLKEWQNSVIRSFGDSWGYMMSPTAFQTKGLEWVRWNMVGTGPFMQEKWQRDVTLSGVKNPNYWEKGKPYLDKIEYLFSADEMSSVALFKTGGCEVINCSAMYAKELGAAGYDIFAQYLGPQHLVPDSANADSPWSNLKVRQAAEYAIDKESIVNSLGYGFWRAAYQFSTPASKAYDPSLPPRKFDLAKAKQLMTEAGYPQGFKTKIIAGPLFLNKDSILAIQNMWLQIGIQTDIDFPDMAKWADLSAKEYKNAVLYTIVNEWGNQNVTFNYFIGTPGRSWLSAIRPPGYKELLDKSKATPEPDPVLLKQIEKMVYDNVVGIPVYSSSLTWAFKKNVRDHGAGTRGQANWYEPQNTWLAK